MFPEFKRITLTGGLEKIDRALAAQSEKLKPYRYDGPTGEKGRWLIKPFTVVEGIQQLRFVLEGGRGMAPGLYHRLVRDRKTTVMSDTDAELIDFLDVMRGVKGRVLVGGLGMGLAIKAMLTLPEVMHIHVIELDKDVIDLVGSHYQNPRVTIEQGDIFKWAPRRNSNTVYDWAWFDIWDMIGADNIPEMRKLKLRFSKYMSGRGGTYCWAEWECVAMQNGIDPRAWYQARAWYQEGNHG